MEFEVSVVGGVESCFVSLPLSLIQSLQSTRSGFLPPLLALQLRSRSNALWHVAWSGSASASSAIEVAQQFAECIDLQDHAIVQVLAIANVSKATQVTIEPDTEDDWEVMDLNSRHAEEAILKQVGVVHEAMRFPLWLHGRTVVTFRVVSVLPGTGLVQLVRGTEVFVAPKGRKKNVDGSDNSGLTSSSKKHPYAYKLLRVQDSNLTSINNCGIEGFELRIAVTSVALIHPETAKKYLLDNFQLVILMPRIVSRKDLSTDGKGILRKRDNSDSKEINNGISSNKKDPLQATVRLIISESVATGHIMLPESLRRYLRADVCSWIYVRLSDIIVKRDVSSLSLSPCQIKMLKEDTGAEVNSQDTVYMNKNYINDYLTGMADADASIATQDWSTYDKVIAALPYGSCKTADDDPPLENSNRKGLQVLLRAWFFAQLDGIASYTGAQVNSLILGNETLLHFQVKVHNFRTLEKTQASGRSMEQGNVIGGLSVEFLFLLTISGGCPCDGKVNGYELVFDEERVGSLGFFLRKLTLAEPVVVYSGKETASGKERPASVSALSWMEPILSDITNRLEVLLSPVSQICSHACNLPLPGHILICGPPGSGKTSLAKAVAKCGEESKNLLAHIVFVPCSDLALEKAPAIRQSLSGYLFEAFDHAPSIIIFDDLDSLVLSPSVSEGSQPSSSVIALTQFLADIMDEYAEKRRSSCGVGPIAFVASVQNLENIPQALTSSGRFDFYEQLSPLGVSERGSILKHEIQKRLLYCSDDILLDIASKCDGYDAYDLVILVDRAIHAAIARLMPQSGSQDYRIPALVNDDFSKAMHEFVPVAMRDTTISVSEGDRSGWETVGGLNDIRNAIKEMIELPSNFPNIFAQAPLRLRSNVLLYGPPGCGKTHIVGAAAAACSLRFISVKGPELLNKYIGASEQAVRDIFSKAAAAAPCLLFFDEFDSIAPKRGHDNTGVTDRVVNQFLTELDGVEALTGVFVFAATSRPDLLDAALLRPGRLDRLLFCDFPSYHERLDILMVLSRKLPLDDDVDFVPVAHSTEGLSGADLQALLSDVQLAAVHELLGNADEYNQRKRPIITNSLLKSVASKARPSVSDAEKRRLHGIYSQFLDSKRSVSEQSRDAKGKRATLA